jgi:lipoprotein-releasing system permease protein
MLFLLVLAGTHGADVELRNKMSGLDSHILIRKRRDDDKLCRYQEIAQRVRRLPSVLAIAPYVWVDVNVQRMDADPGTGKAIPLRLKGVVPELETSVSDINEYLSSHDLQRALGHSNLEIPVVVGHAAAEALRAYAGDGITISKPGQFTVRQFPGTIVDTFDSGTRRDKEIGYTSVASANALIGEDNGCVNILEVRTTDPLKSAEVAQSIERDLGPDYRAVDWSVSYPSYRAVIVLLNKWIFILNLLLGFFASMFSAAAVLLVIYQRRRELAVLITLGMGP